MLLLSTTTCQSCGGVRGKEKKTKMTGLDLNTHTHTQRKCNLKKNHKILSRVHDESTREPLGGCSFMLETAAKSPSNYTLTSQKWKDIIELSKAKEVCVGSHGVAKIALIRNLLSAG